MQKDLNEFERVYHSQENFNGLFELKTDNYRDEKVNAHVMDMDFIGRTFENCLILGGDFTSGSFTDCAFDNCIFLESALVGCNFENCSFKKTEFINIQISLSIGSIKPCHINGLQISHFAYPDQALEFAKRAVFGESGPNSQ